MIKMIKNTVEKMKYKLYKKTLIEEQESKEKIETALQRIDAALEKLQQKID